MNILTDTRLNCDRCGSRLFLACLVALTTITAVFLNTENARAETLPQLRVSENKRFLVKADGTPFFYMGDTAWELFHRLNRQESAQYLQNRADRKFNAIQAVALAELDGVDTPNAYGDLPLLNNNPATPAVTAGNDPNDPAQYDYWDHVDFIVNEAEARGIYTAMLPTWGQYVTPDYSNGQVTSIFNTTNAQTYGEFLGRRYANKPIIWVLGGDRTPSTDAARAVWRAMAKGIAIGVSGSEDYSKVMMTFHPPGSTASSQWFHGDAWLDFNMQQNGHCTNTDVWNRIGSDYNRAPTKPVLDGEPLYEDHPICFNAGAYGYSNDYEIRKFAYWDVFAGAFGHTYGNHSIWQMYAPGREAVNGPINYWYDAINRPGGSQMQYLRNLMESRPFLVRVPDQSVLASDAGYDTNRIQATRGSDGSYLFVYSASGQSFAVNMNKISGSTVKAWWYNPRNGAATAIGSFANTGTQQFVPPSDGAGNDWVLVLDDQARGFGAPGGGDGSTPAPVNLVKAVNVNGSAVTIDGVAFEAEANSGLTVSGGSRFADQNVQLSPAVSAEKAQMIRSSVWNSSGTLNVNLPTNNGTYNVYLYTWEDNNSMDFQLAFEGQAQGGTQSTGAANTWKRLGPYTANVQDGSLTITATGGHFMLSGVEVYQAESPSPTETLVKAINVNGSAVTVGGIAFQAESASGLTTSGGSRFADQSVTLSPATDAARAQMIRSSVWNSSGTLNVNLPVSNGNYKVYLYTWEDNNSMDFELAFEGQAQGGTQSTGAANTWKRLGPYAVTVADGSLTITATGGHFMLSGLEVYQVN